MRKRIDSLENFIIQQQKWQRKKKKTGKLVESLSEKSLSMQEEKPSKSPSVESSQPSSILSFQPRKKTVKNFFGKNSKFFIPIPEIKEASSKDQNQEMFEKMQISKINFSKKMKNLMTTPKHPILKEKDIIKTRLNEINLMTKLPDSTKKVNLMHKLPVTIAKSKFQQMDFIYQLIQLRDNKNPSMGPIRYQDKSTYLGQLRNEKRHGYGIYINPKGNLYYEGFWVEDNPSDKGILIPGSGDIFKILTGNFVLSKTQKPNYNLTGIAVIEYSKGEYYEGELKNGKFHGYGIFSVKKGTCYEGTWVDGEMSGAGKIVYEIGEEYDGEWRKNLKHGFGEMKYKNGSVYRGLWKEGWPIGKGKFVTSQGCVYKGEFFMQDEFFDCGVGVVEFQNGDVYHGEWRKFKLHGKGSMSYADGSKYCGNWVEGVQGGKGYFVDRDGVMKEGKMGWKC